MSDRLLRVSLGLLALAGAAFSGYLVWARGTGAELACSTGGCETVQSSAYAELLGVPVAALGLAAYLLVGATALGTGAAARAVGASVALAALLFASYLLVIQLVVLDAVCDWCLASDAITGLLTAVALLRLRGGLTAAGPYPYSSSSPSESA
ncbi:MAG: vitamin K epoxide reductase family protein [Gaiellaceae bacterium]